MDRAARIARRVAPPEEQEGDDASGERDEGRDDRDAESDAVDTCAGHLGVAGRAASLFERVADHELSGPGDRRREHGGRERDTTARGHRAGKR